MAGALKSQGNYMKDKKSGICNNCIMQGTGKETERFGFVAVT